MTRTGFPAGVHARRMERYYAAQAKIYDSTRWLFLFDRRRIVQDLRLREGDRVLEIGCGTGINLEPIRRCVGAAGEIVAVDCAPSMVARARARVARHGWKNVSVIQQEYGGRPIRPGGVSAVLFSYSLSMIPDWSAALDAAAGELAVGGRLGVVDFCLAGDTAPALAWARWMEWNHVRLDRPYLVGLEARFAPRLRFVGRGWARLWSYYRFVGVSRAGLESP